MKVSWTKYDEEHPNCRKLKAVLAEQVGFLYQQRVTDFYTGCALGVDMWAGEAVLSNIELHLEVKLYCLLSRAGKEMGRRAAIVVSCHAFLEQRNLFIMPRHKANLLSSLTRIIFASILPAMNRKVFQKLSEILRPTATKPYL